MKTLIHFPLRLILLLMAVFILATLCLPAAASESIDTYGISLKLNFSDNESVDHTAEDYHACTFVIQDSSSRYLVAKLDEETGIYHVAGTVAAEAAATRFRAGNNASDPTKLQIVGLSEGTYTMTNYEVMPGFTLLQDPITIAASLDGSTIDGTEVEIPNNRLLELTVNITQGFQLPDLYCYPWQNNPRFIPMAGVFFAAIIGLIICIVRLVKAPKE